MNIKTPDNWRKGQTLFNFLEWVRENKDVSNTQSARMADPFHLDDKKLEEYWEEYQEFFDNS